MYFTGKPCKRGNVAVRLTKEGRCTCDECVEVKRQYVRDWRGKNKEYARQRYWENPDKYRTLKREEYEERKEAILEYQRSYRKENKDSISEYKREYYKRNKSEVIRRVSERKRALKDQTPKWAAGEKDKIDRLYSLVEDLQELTGEVWHVDHMIPLNGETVCGLHCFSNLQPIPAKLNWEKNNSLIYTEYLEWLADYGKPLYTPLPK